MDGNRRNLSSRKRNYQSESDGKDTGEMVKRKTGPFAFAKILIPFGQTGLVMGKNGETIISIQKESDCKILVSKGEQYYPGTTDRVCIISGKNFESVKTAFSLVMDALFKKADSVEMVQLKMLVPNQIAGLVIGKEGSTVKDLQKSHDVSIQLSKKVDQLEERTISISGTVSCVLKAGYEIIEIISAEPTMALYTNVTYSETSMRLPSHISSFTSPFMMDHIMANSSPRLSDFNFALNLEGGSSASTIPPSVLDKLMMTLRMEGFQEFAVSEICSAMTILAKYGILSPGNHYPSQYTRELESFFKPRPGMAGMNDMTLTTHVETVSVPDLKIGAILGSGGKLLEEIQRISGTRISISKKGDYVEGTTDRIVSITGTDHEIDCVKQIITHKINEADAIRASRPSFAK